MHGVSNLVALVMIRLFRQISNTEHNVNQSNLMCLLSDSWHLSDDGSNRCQISALQHLHLTQSSTWSSTHAQLRKNVTGGHWTIRTEHNNLGWHICSRNMELALTVHGMWARACRFVHRHINVISSFKALKRFKANPYCCPYESIISCDNATECQRLNWCFEAKG